MTSRAGLPAVDERVFGEIGDNLGLDIGREVGAAPASVGPREPEHVGRRELELL